MTTPKSAAWVFIVVLTLAVAGFVIYARMGPDTRDRHNLILISIDTLRADRLSAYGYFRNTSPKLDQLAKQGVLFQQALAVAPWTLPTHVTFFTGLYPSSHGVVSSKRRIPAHLPLLAELLQKSGYRTFAYTGGAHVGKRYNFHRGFEHYGVKEHDPATGALGFESALAQAKRQLESLDPAQPYFLFLHTYDVHCPYHPQEPYYSMFNTASARKIATEKCRVFHKQPGFSQENAQYLSDRYDGQVRRMDDHMARLFEFLEARKDLERTVIVFTSDHGEEFFEHGRVGHSHAMNTELLHVPLIVWAPGARPTTISDWVSQVDIMPTILELLNIEAPSVVQGQSLAPLILGRSPSGFAFRAFEYAELHRGLKLRGYVRDPACLVLNLRSQHLDIFPLGQAVRPPGPNSQFVEEALNQMNQFAAGLKPIGREELSDKPPADEIQRLKTLGYF